MGTKHVLDFFYRRRSIRKYKDMDVSPEAIDIILRRQPCQRLLPTTNSPGISS